MSARASAYVIKDQPCDGGVSPNAYVPKITVEIRVHYPPNTVTHREVLGVLSQAVQETEDKLSERKWWRE